MLDAKPQPCTTLRAGEKSPVDAGLLVHAGWKLVRRLGGDRRGKIVPIAFDRPKAALDCIDGRQTLAVVI